MFEHTTKIRVRYGETDQMGVVYHGNYAQYLEIGRVEWLRNLGVSYKDMESKGIMLPVVYLSLNFKKSAIYDEILNIKTKLVKLPTASISFDYEIYNSSKELLVSGNTVLVFVDMKTKKPIKCPKYLLDKMQN